MITLLIVPKSCHCDQWKGWEDRILPWFEFFVLFFIYFLFYLEALSSCVMFVFHFLPFSSSHLFSCSTVFHLLIIPFLFKPVFPLNSLSVCPLLSCVSCIASLHQSCVSCVSGVPSVSLACTFYFLVFVIL